MKIISSISGLRATLVEGKFDNLLVYKYTSAICKLFPSGLILIGRDGRPSGLEIEEFIAQTLNYFKRDYVLLGLVPTPTVQLMVEELDAIIGISITASHNPAEWNGLKFINSNGIFLNADENKLLLEIISEQNIKQIPDTIQFNEDLTIAYKNKLAIEKHIKKILDLHIDGIKLDIDEIKSKKFKVSLDAINSSGSFIIPELLEELGCEVNKINCNGDGEFVHQPEPLPENLFELAQKVASFNSDIGFAIDPDGDRLVLINEKGKPIKEEFTIVLSIWAYLELCKNPREVSIVVNHSTTQLVEKIAERFGAKVHRSPVGEINVVEKMKEINAQIGGEGSGGVILRDFHLGRDAIAGIVLILLLLARKQKKISEIIEELPTTIMKKVKLEFEDDFEKMINLTIPQFKKEKCIQEDGVKFIGPEYWVQLRKSNTEPILRIIAESNTEFSTNVLIDKIFGIVKNI